MGKNKKKLILAKKKFTNRLFGWVIVPALLILLWILVSIIYSSYNSFTVLQYSHSKDNENNFIDRRLLKGQKLIGRFKASENNLGIIEIRFGNVPKVDYTKEDTLVFKIKERNNKKWEYINTYRSGSIQTNGYSPFGFSPITDSKGKTYKFEIESLNGNKLNAVETGHVNPIYLTKYKFSKAEIFNNLGSIIEFASKKITTFLINYESIASSLVFLFPLVLYAVILLAGEKGMFKNKKFLNFTSRLKRDKGFLTKNIFVVFIVVSIIADIFFLGSLFYGFTLVLFVFWCIAVVLNRFESKASFIFAFILILISVVSIYSSWNVIIDKSSSFAYFLIILGFVQSVFETDPKSTKK